ncbi:MAG: endolytic transglycosylase MltG [Candidatus Eisenbacteria bacterium]|uniref:Endolytic murein transglycosylase n=1 Tax=Eiseniibacteriota bacterium TaxID=2212470 RepID=A0A956N9A3_UNCEI|nr:endolytic transglycosylase MltG [Candidatus Eisenbacteria bacterium]
MRRLFLAFSLLVVLALVAAGGLWFARARFLAAPVGPPNPGAELFEIRNGETFGSVARRLEASGWTEQSRLLRLEARFQGWDRRVFPGYYSFREGETTRELMERLASGKIEDTLVTIPEGWRLANVLPLLAESTKTPASEFERIASDPAWLDAQGVPGPGLDGYFLPETYRIPLGQSPERTLEQIVRPATRLWEDSLRTPASELGLDRAKLWALASVIEAEAAVAEERTRISAVFWNRIRRGMKLESDPTVLFALGRPPGRVLYRDLEVDSPYNTYRYPGIPPGPICAPGRDALWAAVRPEPGVDDLFFVARGDGTHVFSKTLSAHNRARIEVRKKR